MRQARAAGVREASGEGTAGQVHWAAPCTMGKVAPAAVWWCALTIESGWREALAYADEPSWRRMWRLRAWWRHRRCSGSIRHQRERRCRRSRKAGPDEEHWGVVLA